MNNHHFRKFFLAAFTPLLLLSLATVSAQGNTPPAIVLFEAETEDMTFTRTEQALASVTFRWATVGMEANHRVQLQARVLGQWVTVEPELDPSGTITRVAAHPLDFDNPAYRLLIVPLDENNVIRDDRPLDASYLSVPYVAPEDWPPDQDDAAEPAPPSIGFFNVHNSAVSRAALRDGSARLTVAWQVEDRIPSSHILFQQIMSGQTINVELPRASLWIQSVGEGVVAPVDPGTDEVIIQISVIDILTGIVYDSAQTAIPITEIAPPVPTATVPSPPPSGGPEITSFTVAPQSIAQGGSVSASWAVRGADSVTLRLFDSDNPTPGVAGEFVQAYSLEGSSGLYTIALPDRIEKRAVFMLSIESVSPAVTMTRDVTVANNAPTACTVSPLDVPWVVPDGAPESHLCRNAQGLQIANFNTSAFSVTPAQNITFNWTITDADGAILELYDAAQIEDVRNGAADRPIPAALYESLPATGSQAVSVPEIRGGLRAVLWGYRNAPPGPNVARMVYAVIDLSRSTASQCMIYNAMAQGILGGPGLEHAPLGQLGPNTRSVALARTSDEVWYKISYAGAGGFAWIQNLENVTVEGDCSTLMIEDPIAGQGCYQPPLIASHGIATGEEARVVLRVGLMSHVSYGQELGTLETGEVITILDGPYCFNGQNVTGRMWKIRMADGREGYANEYSASDTAQNIFLEPGGGGEASCFDAPYLPAQGIAVGEKAAVQAVVGLMSSPAPRGTPLGELEPGMSIDITDGPYCYGSETMHVRQWKVSTADGREGYVSEYAYENGTRTTYLIQRPSAR